MVVGVPMVVARVTFEPLKRGSELYARENLPGEAYRDVLGAGSPIQTSYKRVY